MVIERLAVRAADDLPVSVLVVGGDARATARLLRSPALDARGVRSCDQAVTLLGLSLPGIFSGALITEAIYNYPGMGLLFWDSAMTRDYPVLLGVTLVVAVATVAGNLLADVFYAVVDPRVRITD